MNRDCPTRSAVTLMDVVHAAPRLLEVLPPESLKALSATCSFLHTWTRTRITALTLPTCDHLTLLQPQQWPSLCVVWITATAGTFVSACLQRVRRDWVVLADTVSRYTLDAVGKTLILVMPATKHSGSHGLAPCQIHLPAMSQFAKHSKEAKSKVVSVNLLDKEDGSLRQLSSMAWPHLSVLAIFSDRIGSDAFLNLNPNNLPSLTTFTIRARNFDTQAAVHLAKGLPRVLSSLLLFTNIDAAAAHHLSTADWPNLVDLRINSPMGMHELHGSQSLDAASVQKLAQGRWPLLEELDLSCNDLDQCAIGHLVQGRWPVLRHLTLDSKCMTAAVCDMLCVVDVLDQLQAIQCEMAKPGFGSHFQLKLKRLSSTIWPLLQAVCVVCK